MPTKCLTPVRGKMSRYTRLDQCGRVVLGPDSVVTSKGFVSVALTVNTEATDAISVPNAAGEKCVNEPGVTTVTGITAVVTFCNVDPDIYILTTGANPVLDAFGNTVGFDVDTATSPSDVRFALEVWTGISGGGGCADGGTGQFGYLLLPYMLGGTVGDYTIENGAVSFSIANATSLDGNAWGVGPYNVVLDADGEESTLLNGGITSTTHHRFMLTDVAPPEAACGARPLLDSAAPALTSITATAVGLDATVAPTPAGADPWWADFGDGTWDYSEGGTSLVHTYEAAGTYTITAQRGTSEVTTTVTVTAP
jgi:hypothetical protein